MEQISNMKINRRHWGASFNFDSLHPSRTTDRLTQKRRQARRQRAKLGIPNDRFENLQNPNQKK